jgi:site-specific DNA recombinase
MPLPGPAYSRVSGSPKVHASWGRPAHRLEPDPETAHIVRWIFAQRLCPRT